MSHYMSVWVTRIRVTLMTAVFLIRTGESGIQGLGDYEKMVRAYRARSATSRFKESQAWSRDSERGSSLCKALAQEAALANSCRRGGCLLLLLAFLAGMGRGVER